MPTAIDIDTISALLVETAQEVVLPRYMSLARHEIEEKTGPNDLVTAADLESEAFLSERLHALLPEAAIVGEEGAAADRRILKRLSAEGYVWIVDPIDGTYNFAHGDENFCIIVALVRDGRTVAGWIHHPLRGVTIASEIGQGAWLDGRRLEVAKAGPIKEMRAILYVGPTRAPELFERVKKLRDRLGPRSYTRCAATEYMALAEGVAHYAMFTRQLPWDHAAGCRIVEECGGHIAYFDGTPYLPVEDARPLLLAPDRDSWHGLREFFHPSDAAA